MVAASVVPGVSLTAGAPSRSRSVAGVDPTDAVLFQHPGQGHPANPLASARGRQAPPQVERPRRRDIVVNRVEELRVVTPELLPHPIRQAHALPRQLLAQARPLA